MSETLRVFKSNLPSSKYHFKNGKEAAFVSGRYLTANETEIEELEKEIKLGHPHIYIDSKEKEVTSSSADPMAGLRAKFFAEFQAQESEKAKAAALGDTKDLGSTDQSQIKPAATSVLGPQVAGAAQTVKVNIPSKVK